MRTDQVNLCVSEFAVYPGRVFDMNQVDLDEIAAAPAGQDYFEHRWLIDPRPGELVFWAAETGIDRHHPVDLDQFDDLDLAPIDPLPSYVWHQDMADFCETVADLARQHLTRDAGLSGATYSDTGNHQQGLNIDALATPGVPSRGQYSPAADNNLAHWPNAAYHIARGARHPAEMAELRNGGQVPG